MAGLNEGPKPTAWEKTMTRLKNEMERTGADSVYDKNLGVGLGRKIDNNNHPEHDNPEVRTYEHPAAEK